jgi:hypothetical protein
MTTRHVQQLVQGALQSDYWPIYVPLYMLLSSSISSSQVTLISELLKGFL